MIKIHEKIQTKKQIKIYRVIAMWFDLRTLVIPVLMEAFALKIKNVRIYIEYIQKEPEINTNTNIKTNTSETGKR